MDRHVLRRSVSLALVIALMVPQGVLASSTPLPVQVGTAEALAETANSNWNQIVRSYGPEDITVEDDAGDWQINFGIFPLSTSGTAANPGLSPFWGISFVRPFRTSKEIFSECPQKSFEYDQIHADELIRFIKNSMAGREHCKAASALRTLFLADLAAFEKIDGWNTLLRALENAGAIRDFNIELSQYLKYKNPGSQAQVEELRFRQLELYARFIPSRHVNPRGTLKKVTYASEFSALIRLFMTSYPESRHRADVQRMEANLFNDYVMKFSIPVLPVTLPEGPTTSVLIQEQKAFTPLALSFDYPVRVWTASPAFIEKIMKGKESLFHSRCGCSYQAPSTKEITSVAEVDGLGYSRLDSLEKAQDVCVRLAQEDHPSRKGVAFTHECSQTEVPLDETLLASLKEDYHAALLRDKIWEKTKDRIIPSYQKVLAGALTVLFSAFTWRNRGGGPYALGSTQQARILFALLPQTLIGATFGYLEDGWSGARVGATAGALMTPALLIPWGRQMDVGRLNGDKWEDFALLNLRGLLQTLPAAYYLHSEGKDAAPVLLGGLGMGPCYFASWQWGDSTTVAKNWGTGLVDAPTAWGELCWGGTLGLGLMKSLTTKY